MKTRSGKNLGRRFLSLALALVMCVSLLNITALAMDVDGSETRTLICGQEETEGHTHTSACHDLTAGPICGQEEGTGHTHTDECKGEIQTLVCTTPETAGHSHSDACYTESTVLTCTASESAGHTHGGGCYDEEDSLICGQEEAEGHTHSDGCYTTEKTLTCDLEEAEGHTHTSACFETTSGYTCGMEAGAGAHTHTTECYPLTCGKAAAKGHTHTDACYAPADDPDAEVMLTSLGSESFDGDAEAQDVQDLLKDVTITDTDGNDVGGKLQIGKDYKISLTFREGGVQGSQFSTSGTLTYQLPEFFKVTAKSGAALYATIDGVSTLIGSYSVSDSGLLTVELSDAGKTALDAAGDVALSFEMEATAQANPGSTGGSVNFGGAGGDFTFEVVDQPQATVKKNGEYKENETHTGGTLSYTVKVTVEHGEVRDAAIKDVLTPPQLNAFSLSDPKNITVTLTRDGEVIPLEDGDYTLEALEGDPGHPDDKAFQVKFHAESRYAPLRQGDELCVAYSYEVGVNDYSLRLWANMENVAAFTGTMPVEDPSDPGKVEYIPVEEQDTDSHEVFVTPSGHGVICKDQSYSEATKTLHYTCYTVVPAGTWAPLYIYDDMYTQYNGEKWYLQEFGEGGRVKNLKVSAVDVENWFGGDDWADKTTDDEKLESLGALKGSATELTGFNMDGDLTGYDKESLDQYVFLRNKAQLHIVFGYEGNRWGKAEEWGSHWSYDKDRLIITEYDLDMSGTETDTMTLYNMDFSGRTLELTPEQVLRAGITNNVYLRYGGYYPGYSVFFNNVETMTKTGKLNKADGTIDYTVSINTTDSTVRDYFKDLTADLRGCNWNYDNSLQAVFYDVLPEGWEYVPDTLYAVARDRWGNEQVFPGFNPNYTKWGNPLDGDGNISAPLVLFYNKDGTGNNRANHELFNAFSDDLAALEFHYTLKATPEWLKAHAADNDPTTVHNHAEIKDKNSTHWSADEDVAYYPAKLTKKAKQVEADANLMAFTIEINPQAADFDPNSEYLTVTDTSTNLQIKLDSIQVKDTAGTDVAFKLLPATEKGQFKLQVPDGMALTITYNAVIPEKGLNVAVSNAASIDGVPGSDSGYNEILNVNKIYGIGSGSTYEMTVEKADRTDGARKLAGAEFKYYIVRAEGSSLDEKAKITVGKNEYSVYTEDGWTYTTDENGTFTLTEKMEPGNYYILKETKAPEGYELPDGPILFYFGFAEDMDTVNYPGVSAVIPDGTMTVTNQPTTPTPAPDTHTDTTPDPEPGPGPGPSPDPDPDPETPPPAENIPDNPPPLEDLPDDVPPLSDIPYEELPVVEIPEEEPPMAEAPVEEQPTTEIPDEDIPLDDVPQTGDNSHTALLLALMACSGLGMTVLGIQSKKREDEEQ